MGQQTSKSSNSKLSSMKTLEEINPQETLIVSSKVVKILKFYHWGRLTRDYGLIYGEGSDKLVPGKYYGIVTHDLVLRNYFRSQKEYDATNKYFPDEGGIRVKDPNCLVKITSNQLVLVELEIDSYLFDLEDKRKKELQEIKFSDKIIEPCNSNIFWYFYDLLAPLELELKKKWFPDRNLLLKSFKEDLFLVLKTDLNNDFTFGNYLKFFCILTNDKKILKIWIDDDLKNLEIEKEFLEKLEDYLIENI